MSWLAVTFTTQEINSLEPRELGYHVFPFQKKRPNLEREKHDVWRAHEDSLRKTRLLHSFQVWEVGRGYILPSLARAQQTWKKNETDSRWVFLPRELVRR